MGGLGELWGPIAGVFARGGVRGAPRGGSRGVETPRRRGGKNTRRISATSVEVETRRGLGDAPASALGGEMALAATAFPRPSLLEASCGFSARLEGEMELLAAAQRTPAARLWIRGGGADKEFVRAGRVVSAGWRGLAGARRVRRE